MSSKQQKSYYLEPELAREVKVMCAQLGITASEAVTEALRNWLQEQQELLKERSSLSLNEQLFEEG